MRVIAVANQKGGCGKTTTAINLSACLAANGRRVLLMDLDPQGHASLGLGILAEDLSRTMFDVIATAYEEPVGIESVMIPVEQNLDVAPCNLTIASIEQKLSGTPGRENRLRYVLEQAEGVIPADYVIIDCPPNVGLLTFNALRASGEVLIPVEMSPFAMHGLDKLIETIDIFRYKLGHSLRVHILPTMFDPRTRMSHDCLERVINAHPYETLPCAIHTSVRLKESAGRGKPITRFGARSRSFHDYCALAEQIQRLGEDRVDSRTAVEQVTEPEWVASDAPLMGS